MKLVKASTDRAVLAGAALTSLLLCGAMYARLEWLALAMAASPLPAPSDLLVAHARRDVCVLAALLLALPGGLVFRALSLARGRLHVVQERLDQLPAVTTLTECPAPPGGADELDLALHRVEVEMWTTARREQERTKAIVQQQQTQLKALQQIDEAERLIGEGRITQAVDHLAQVPPDLGKVSRKARSLRLQAILELGSEVQLEAEVRRGHLESIPPRVIRRMAKQFEELERYDLALETMNALLRLSPDNPVIIHDRDRVAQLHSSLESEAIQMELIRRALGERFTRVRFHAAGGMSIVLKAMLKDERREVAIKLLPPALGHQVDLRRRLERELRVLMTLDHPNIVRVLGPIEGEVVGYYMEMLRGDDLLVYLRRRGQRLPLPEAADVMQQIVEGLHCAHERGMVHRDVKPANFIRDRDGHVKLVDFGITYMVDATMLTRETCVIGTPGYMAPEQTRVDNEPISEKSDIYATGVMFYEMLAGHRPFPEDQVMVAKLTRSAPPLRYAAPDLPEDVTSLVDCCLRRSPRERDVTCAQIVSLCRSYARRPEADVMTTLP